MEAGSLLPREALLATMIFITGVQERSTKLRSFCGGVIFKISVFHV
jgi:hypothetical protein